MATRIKSSQIADGTIVAADLHSAITVNTTSSGTFGSVIVDNYTLGSNRISTNQANSYNGDIMLDAAGKVILDTDVGNVQLKDNGQTYAEIERSNGNVIFYGAEQDKNIEFKGNVSGTATTALTLDFANSGRATFAENVSVGGDLTVTGDLTVEGSQVTLNTTALDVEDKNITLNYHASNDTSASADGAGITIQDAVDASNDASILWDASDDQFDFSHGVNVSGNSNIAGNLDLAGSTTEVRSLQIGHGRTGDGISLIDLVGDTTYSDYGFRVQRTGGANGKSSLLHHGTGNLEIRALEAATIRFKTTDADRMQIKSAGDIHFYDTAGDPGMVWDASEGSDGALLIGGHTALRSGSVAGRNDAQLSLESTNFHNASFVANQDNSNGYHLIIGKSRGTNTVATVGGVDIVEPLDEIGSLVFAAADGTDLRPKVAQISAYVPSGTTPAVNAVSGELRFGTTNQAQDVTNHMVLDKDGKVGIGILTPETLLHVQKSSSALYASSMSGTSSYTPSGADIIQVRNSNSGVDDIYAGIWFETGNPATNTTGTDRSGRIALVVDNDNSYSSNFVFQTRGTAGTLTEKMRITQDGNVGMGTDTPSAFLDVRRDNNNTGNQFQVADTEGTTVGVRSYTTADGTGIIMNHYYAKSGGDNKYLRHADIVSNMSDGAAADFRFFTKDQDSNPRVAMSLSATGAIHTGAQQVRHNLQPALSLDFANSSTIDTRIQYAREGVATYFDRNGVMKYAQHNEPRIDYDPDTGECKGLLVEEQRTNWMTYPNEFGFNQWSLPGLTVFQNAGLAPDGTMSADLLIPDTSYTGRHFGYKVTPGAFLSGITYNISCYFKAYGGFSESCKLGYRVDSDTQSGDLYGSGFQIADGEPAGNGWYRHSLTVAVGTNASLNFAEFILGDQNGYTPTGGKGVYMWGFSVENAVNNTGATFPTSFIPTIQKFKTRASTSATYTRSDGVITTAGQHQARYDHGLVDGVWRSKGLLLESAATNLSQNFYYPASTLRWNSGVQNATITPDTSILAPDGTYNNVVRFKETTNNAATTASVYKPIAGTANTQRCFSVYAKKKELKMMRLYFDGTTPLCGQVIYNLDLGTIHTAQNPSNTDAWGIEDAGNGWWRCWFSGTVTGGQSTYYIHIDSADDFGNTSHQNTVNYGFYLWGPQMEYSGAPTSYIYTDDSAVTRTLDQCDAEDVTRYGDDIKMYDLSWYNSQESTIYGEGTSISANNDTGSNPALWGLTDGTSSNRYLLRRFSNDVANDPSYGGYTFRLQQTMPDGTSYNNDFFSPTADGLGEWDDSNVHKMAMSISPGNQIGAADGRDAQITSVTTMPAYTQPTMVQIGHAGSSDYWNGHIRKLAYYPTQLNISEMKALTETDT